MSTAIIPYAARGALYGYRASKRMRMAGGIAGHIYRNRGAYYRAARTIGRAWRRRSRRGRKRIFSRTQIGERVGTTTAKAVYTANIPKILDTRTLYQTEITSLPQKASFGENNTRLRQIANVRGFKVCMEVRNQSENPMYFNIAVISPKDSNAVVSEPGFFRGYTQSNRSVDFSTGRSSNEFHCLPINADKYTVLKHKRYRLIPVNQAQTVYNDHSGHNYMNIGFYTRLKRQVRYQENGVTESGKCYLVYWCDEFLSSAGTPSVSEQMQVNEKVVTYFKEPKH